MLHASGVKLAIATSSDEQIFLPALEHNGIRDLFSAAVMVREVARGKEFPDVYLLCAERIGAKPSESAVFEDIAAGLRGAKSGGFYTVAVREPLSAPQEAEIRKLADQYINDFYDLL